MTLRMILYLGIREAGIQKPAIQKRGTQEAGIPAMYRYADLFRALSPVWRCARAIRSAPESGPRPGWFRRRCGAREQRQTWACGHQAKTSVRMAVWVRAAVRGFPCKNGPCRARRGAAWVWGCQKSDGQTVTAFGTTGAQHGTATTRFLANQKTMSSFTTADGGLIGALHGEYVKKSRDSPQKLGCRGRIFRKPSIERASVAVCQY